MADYAKTVVRCREASSGQDTLSREEAISADFMKFREPTVGTTSYLLYDDSVENWTSVDMLYVENKKRSGGSVTVSWELPVLGAMSVVVAPGEVLKLPSASLDTADITLAAASGEADLLVILVGA